MRIGHYRRMQADAVTLLYATCPDAATAEAIAAVLLRDKLAACVNILAPITSLYEWEGQAERAREVPMLVKTRTRLVPAAMRAIAEVHPYECPCILQWPQLSGHRPFLDWVLAQTADAKSGA